MNAERLKQIEEIYHAALEIAAAERDGFLTGRCGEDVELRREVETLLAFEKTENTFLDTPLESLAAGIFSEKSAPADLTGRQIGQYEILSLLGEGGMGAVYLAQDTKLLRRVALKILPAETTNDPNRVRRFVHEARAASALNHPHILTIYDVGQSGELHYIAMEFVDGETLHDLIHHRQSDKNTLIKYLTQTAEGLAKAHEAGIVHRDLKPENIMVSRDGYAKILDFGLAKLVGAETGLHGAQQHRSIQGVIMGTLGYMSPEQARASREIDARSDIFSFGCILYEALGGRKPFTGESTFDVLEQIVHAAPEPLDAPPELRQIIDKCLKKSPSERFQSIREVAGLLRKAEYRAVVAPVREEKTPVASPAPVTRTISRAISEERRQATILFADLAGVSEALEELEPEESGALVRKLLAALDKAVEKGKGKIEKRLNDFFIAVWGTHSVSEDDPENAIRTALELRKTTGEFARGVDILRENGGQLLKIGIGTGTILRGKSSDTGEFLTSGATVNVARRLQRAAKGGEILIAHETYRHVRGVFDIAEVALPETGVKSKVYSVKRAKTRAFRLQKRGVEGIETELVGRRGELEKMLDGLQTVFDDGEMQIFTVIGEAGLGKSRLLFEFRDQIELLPEKVRVFNGRATETMYGLPYSLVRDLFSFRFEIQDDDTPATAREKFVRGMTELWPENPNLDEEVGMKIHFIGHLAGFDFSESVHLRDILADAQQIHNRALHYAAQFFTAVARRVPSVVYLDDLHWADSESLDFFEFLARNCPDAPLLILEFARPAIFERRPHWGEGQTHRTRLALAPLTKRESRQLVDDILQKMPGGASAGLRDLIVSNAEGNPFYIEELVKMLIDQGTIAIVGDEWLLDESRLGATRVPGTLAGVLQARLDRLDVWEKRVLQRASVVGREFWNRSVADFGDEIDVDVVLESLRRKELLFRHETSAFAGAVEYLFKHAILRDVTYETVLLGERRAWHEKTAEWLVNESGGRAGEYAATIAGHFEKSPNPARAAVWFGRAGRQSFRTHAAETAIFYFQKALQLVEDGAPVSPPELIDWWSDLGKSYWYRADYATAIANQRRMVELAEAAGDQLQTAEAYCFLSAFQFESGAGRESLESAKRAVAAARAAGDGDAARIKLVFALYRQSRTILFLGNSDDGIVIAEEGLRVAESLGEKAVNEQGFCYHALATAALKKGDFERAVFFVEHEIAAMRRVKNIRALANGLNTLGEIKRLQGDAAGAIPIYEEALAIAREIGSRAGEILFMSNVGGAMVANGDYENAERQLRGVVEKAGGTGHFVLEETYRFLAEALLFQNRAAEALDWALKSLAYSEKSESNEGIGLAWRILGQIAARTNENPTVGEESFDAAQCFEKALKILADFDIKAEEGRTLQEMARFERGRGNLEKADALMNRAREIFVKLKMPFEAERA
ncbi:MAG: protein kinase [Acidobacteria bacterium]|nr:protein kinase [Acidobacteriota bacterium]